MALFSSLSFLYPWVLAALLALPVIWWLLRLIPPQPKTVSFPAIQFLYHLKKDEQTARTTPWWLLLLRLLLAALIIIAIAGPIYNLPEQSGKDGDLVIIVDDGWTAAETWDDLRTTFNKVVTEATRQQRQIFIVTASQSPSLKPLADHEALGIAASLQPKSWSADYSALRALLPRIQTLNNPEFMWFSSGVTRDEDVSGLEDFFKAVTDIGPLTIFRAETIVAPPVIGVPKIAGETLNIPLTLPTSAPPASGILTARAATGKILASAPFAFDQGDRVLNVTLDIPNKVRNDIKRLEISNTANAGSVFLLDRRWQRHQIGLVSDEFAQNDQPLLDENHYLTQALTPFFDIKRGKLEDLVSEEQSLIALGDTANLPEGLERSLTDWVMKGGILVRFAGPKLANSNSALVPVVLRSGNRSLQGAMSWNKPAHLGPVPPQSPFATLKFPEEITVTKQVLANPSPDLLDKTWAQLEDGTPLVTAAKRGSGWIVLFHTTATPEWSNLALSGLFVEMLREVGNLAQFGNKNVLQKRSLPPYQLLDGFGNLSDGLGAAEPLDTAALKDMVLGPDHPPGYYGDDNFSVALNIGQDDATYSLIDPDIFSASLQYFDKSLAVDLVMPLLLAAILLVLADLLISLYLQGKLPALRRPVAIAVILLLGVGYLSTPETARAQMANPEGDAKILEATLDTRLGYIVTHDPATDNMSRAGLSGLSQQLRNRTAIEAKEPLAVDIERDELIFYPLIYWPVTTDFPPLSEQAVLKLNDYFKGGGTILFDTRNENSVGGFGLDLSNSPENMRLRQLLSRLDIPRLHPVPVDHVVTRSFYLMQAFPGRYAGGEVWIEDTTGNQGTDGVASILIGSNDWAAAWAVDEDGHPLAATLPGTNRQREMAYRFGINLVMYTLTGNYKSDQVHIPAILERLGQ